MVSVRDKTTAPCTTLIRQLEDTFALGRVKSLKHCLLVSVRSVISPTKTFNSKRDTLFNTTILL